MSAAKKKQKTLRIQQVKSGIGRPEKHKKVLKSLGFTRLNQVREVADAPQIRGQIGKIPHLVVILGEEDAK
jgi:large subunit ribosomal protein L30